MIVDSVKFCMIMSFCVVNDMYRGFFVTLIFLMLYPRKILDHIKAFSLRNLLVSKFISHTDPKLEIPFLNHLLLFVFPWQRNLRFNRIFIYFLKSLQLNDVRSSLL